VLGVPVEFELPVPVGPARPVDLLPQFRAMGEALVSFSVQVSQADGKTVSCGPNCGACCRQLVPISQLEARGIRDLVEGLPEPRRTIVRERFAAARARFAEAGLLDQLLEPDAVAADQHRPFALAYFRQGVACPFLEDESCSIYADRPISCREYLVTSPAANCSTPTAESIACVPVPLRASNALAGLTAAGPSAFVPLVVAPEWAANHPEPPAEARTGPQILEQFLGCLLKRERMKEEG
jgi:Fe-S-cluster containining protein